MSQKLVRVCFLVVLILSLFLPTSSMASSPQLSIGKNEEAELRALENLNPSLLQQRATGDSCSTRCSNDPNSGERICKTVCDSDSSSGGYTGGFNGPVGSSIGGCLIGALLGSLGGGAAAVNGCAIGAVLFFGLDRMKSN